MNEQPRITSHRIQNELTEYLVLWEDGESTWETKEDLENSEYKNILHKYIASFSRSDIPIKIIGKSLDDNTLFVRWNDGTYEYTSNLKLIELYPELFI